MKPQSPPAITLAKNMQTISSQFGTTSRRQIMQAAAARQPARVWPSPPTFQKRMRKAGVTAREMVSRMATFCRVTQVLRAEPKEPERIVP